MTDINLDDEDVVKEMYDGEYPRVDIVAGPASGMRFVVLKAGDTQPDPATILGAHTPMTVTDPAPVLKADDPSEPLPDGDELMDDAKPGAAGLEVPTDAPGDPDDPDSPAWEAVDAARARQAVNMVIALQRLVQTALARESQEAVVGDDGEDAENAYDLADVLDSLDCVLDTLAPFAVGEQAEANEREADAMSMVTKAGRILSGANEGLIRSAMQQLQTVIATLPAATEPEGTEVTKSETIEPVEPAVETVEKAAEPAEATEPAVEPVEKAAGDPMMAVYTQGGKLIGAIDPTKVTPLSTGDDDDDDDGDDDTDADPDDTADPAAAPPAAPAAVAPGVPVAVAKAADTTDPTEVLKSILADTIREALAPLGDRVAKMEATPAVGGPLLNGATGQLFLRGQNTTGDPEIEQVQKAMESTVNPVERADLNRKLVLLQLRRMHQP